jgi:hypothetical protein
MLTAERLFDEAEIEMCGPVAWKTRLPETGPGIYVITTIDTKPDPRRLDETSLKRWIYDEVIVYIGRSKNLRRRLNEFYRHKHGASRPHHGGQNILLLDCQLQVYWGTAGDYQAAERRLIETFKNRVQSMPFANHIRAARPAL